MGDLRTHSLRERSVGTIWQFVLECRPMRVLCLTGKIVKDIVDIWQFPTIVSALQWKCAEYISKVLRFSRILYTLDNNDILKIELWNNPTIHHYITCHLPHYNRFDTEVGDSIYICFHHHTLIITHIHFKVFIV